MRFVSLLIRLALAFSVGVAIPGALALDSAIVAKAGARTHVRRAVPVGAAAAVTPRVGRDGARFDPSLRGKHSASALPAVAPVVPTPTATAHLDAASFASQPLDRHTSSSPRGPPSLT